MNNFLSQIESFFTNLKKVLIKGKNDIAEKKKNGDEERYDVSIDEVRSAHEKVPKKIGAYILVFGVFTILVMTFLTVHQQVLAVNKKKEMAHDSNKSKSPAVEISIDDQSWKHYQNKKIEAVAKNTKKQLNETLSEFTKISKKTTLEIKQDLNNTQEFVKKSIVDMNKKLNDKVSNIQSMVADKLKENIDHVNKKISNIKNNPVAATGNNGFMQLNSSSTILPPPLANLKSTKKIVKNDVDKKIKIEEQEEYNEYDDIEIDNIEIQKDDIKTALYQNTVEKKKKSLPYHIMQGLTNATLLTGVNAPTFSSNANDRAPVLLSIDGNTLIANGDENILANCLVTGAAQGNVNTSRADILLTGLSCSGTDKEGNSVKIEQSIKGWVMGEDGALGLQGRLVDSSGKVITKMIAVSLIKGMTAAAVAAAQPSGSVTTLTGGSSPAANAQVQVANGLGNGVADGIQHIQEHYNQILTGMYPTISVRAGKKVSILFKGGEDMEPKVYKNIDIYNNLSVNESAGGKK